MPALAASFRAATRAAVPRRRAACDPQDLEELPKNRSKPTRLNRFFERAQHVAGIRGIDKVKHVVDRLALWSIQPRSFGPQKPPQPTNIGSSFAVRLGPSFLYQYLPKKPGNWVLGKAKSMEVREIIAALHRELEFLEGLILSLERQGPESVMGQNDGPCRPRIARRRVRNSPRKAVHRRRRAD